MTAPEEGVWSVSALNHEIRRDLEDRFDPVRVEGEVSGLKRSPSGHVYFTLKDEDSALSSVMWRSTAARIPLPENGDRVVAAGRISVFEPRGQYQLIVSAFRPVGEGDLQRRLEELRKRLEAEGLFSSDRDFPAYPQRVAVITSPTGAVLHDICNVLSRRNPTVELLLVPTPVQGVEAVPGIIAAFERLARIAGTPFEPDLVIVARGGGSLEDLWAFNDEAVVRAVAACPWPVISGVGHETDFTLCDSAADLRAPTPSAAAELCAPQRDALLEELSAYTERMGEALLDTVERRRERLENLAGRPCLNHPEKLLEPSMQRLDWLSERLNRGSRHQLERRQMRFAELLGRLEALSPLKVLARGYAAAETPEGRILASVRGLTEGQEIWIRFGDGRVRSRILSVEDARHNEKP